MIDGSYFLNHRKTCRADGRSIAPTLAGTSLNERSLMMKRLLTILATALVASTLLTGAAEARGGGGGGGHMGGGFGGHMGGIGHIDGGFGGHMGGVGHVGGFGHVDHPVYGFHAMHRFGRHGYGVYDGYNPECDLPYVNQTLPPFCS
jgi:hypothetical protein